MMNLKTKRPTAVMHKNTGLIHLPALAGEDVHKLNHLMHDTRSEFSKNIRTYNMAVNASMNRHLSQSLRDVHSNIEYLNRSQQATYKTMCKIINIQKKRTRETYQNYQQKLRDKNLLSLHTTVADHAASADGGGQSDPAALSQNKSRRKAAQGMKLPALKDEEITSRNQEENAEINHIQINKEIDAIQRVRDSQVEIVSKQDTNQTMNDLQENCLPMNSDVINSSETWQAESGNDTTHEHSSGLSADVTQAPKCSKLDTKTDSTQEADDENLVSTSLPDKLSSFAVRTTSKKAFFTASLRPSLPPITESNTDNQGNTNPVVRQEETTAAGLLMNKSHHIAGTSVYGGSTVTGRSDVGSPAGSIEDTVISAQRATSLRARIADLERKHMREFLKKQNLDTKPKPYQLQITDESGSLKSSTDDSSDNTAAADTKSKVSRSIVLERKRLAKLRQAHRKAVLNSENNYEYVQMSDGSFKRVSNYKKKKFLPPSNREEYERRQIIKSELARAENNNERIGSFFTKLDLPLPSEIIKKKSLKRKESKAELDTQETSQPETESVPQPVKREKSKVIKPLSEVAKSVAYIRQYIRPADRGDDINRNTSWSQSY